jgi:hypothetical protein
MKAEASEFPVLQLLGPVDHRLLWSPDGFLSF